MVLFVADIVLEMLGSGGQRTRVHVDSDANGIFPYQTSVGLAGRTFPFYTGWLNVDPKPNRVLFNGITHTVVQATLTNVPTPGAVPVPKSLNPAAYAPQGGGQQYQE